MSHYHVITALKINYQNRTFKNKKMNLWLNERFHDGRPKFRLDGKNEKKMYFFYLGESINGPQNGFFCNHRRSQKRPLNGHFNHKRAPSG